MTDKPACERCKFWILRPDESMGECHRHPPVLCEPLVASCELEDRAESHSREDNGELRPLGERLLTIVCDSHYPWIWPITHWEHWCGEFKPAKRGKRAT